MTAAAAALRTAFSSPSRPITGDWSLPIAIVIAIAAHTALLLGLDIKSPQPDPRPTQRLELMVVTQSEPSAAVPALVSAQTDRAGETQALLPDVETVAAGAIDSNLLSGAEASASNAEQPLKPSKELEPAQPPEQRPVPAEATESPQPPERAKTAIPALEALPARPASASLVRATSVDPEAMHKPKADPATDESLSVPTGLEFDQPPQRAISAADIFASRNAEMANLAARIEERSQAYASRTRRKAISTATREYIYANYMEAWRRKVERIGNLNYPREARELGLFGSLILHVAVRADGSLEGIRVVRSSGHEVLDQAAVRIVELAAPFAPFPPNIKQETDVLDITRTWQFQRNHELSWGN